MATRVFADEELQRLREFPEISREELFRYFTLTPADLAFVAPQGRGPAVRLGLAVALCTLPWLGFVPDKVPSAPPVAVARLADQLNIDAAQLRSYGKRAQTRTEHVRLVAQYLGWRPAGAMELKELDEFLLARAMEHDSPTLLFRLACEYLISARVIRPGPETVVRRVAHARTRAQRETYDRLAREFTPQRCKELDALLVVDPSIEMSRLRWLSTGPVEASATAVKAEVEKLVFLRNLGADELDMSVLPAERRRFLATVGRRLTGQALERRDPVGVDEGHHRGGRFQVADPGDGVDGQAHGGARDRAVGFDAGGCADDGGEDEGVGGTPGVELVATDAEPVRGRVEGQAPADDPAGLVVFDVGADRRLRGVEVGHSRGGGEFGDGDRGAVGEQPQRGAHQRPVPAGGQDLGENVGSEVVGTHGIGLLEGDRTVTVPTVGSVPGVRVKPVARIRTGHRPSTGRRWPDAHGVRFRRRRCGRGSARHRRCAGAAAAATAAAARRDGRRPNGRGRHGRWR